MVYITQIYFLTVMEAKIHKSRYQPVWFLVRDVLACQQCLLTVSSQGGEKPLTLLDLGPTLMTSLNLNYFLKIPLSNTVTLWGQSFNIQRDIIQSTAPAM